MGNQTLNFKNTLAIATFQLQTLNDVTFTKTLEGM